MNSANQKTEPSLIGTQYTTRGKHPRLCTVVDEHTTYTSNGSIYKVKYVSTHVFLGQPVTNYDVARTTILMNKVN